jgi:hypothetical protein
MKRLLLIIVLVVGTMILYVCCSSDNTCHQNLYVVTEANFYTLKNDTATIVTMDSIWVKGLNNDSIIYNNTKSVSSINLPLRKMQDTTVFVVRFNNVYDTLHIVYTNNRQYLSLECGCLVTQTLDSTYSTHHKIKRSKITQPNVGTTEVENLQIYF